MSNKLPSYAQLIEYYQTTNGLYMIDRNPSEVGIDWIRENAFQPKLVDYNNLTKEPKEAQDEFFGIEDTVDRLYNYIITGDCPESVKPEKKIAPSED